MLIATLPTDLHLYSKAAGLVQHAPLVPVLATDAAHSAAAQQPRPEGALLRPISQPDPGVKHPFSGPFKPATHPVDRRDELQQAAQWSLWADPLAQSEQVGERPRR